MTQDDGVLGGDTGCTSRHRRLPSQQLFDDCWNDGAVRDDLASMVRMLGEEGIKAAQRVAHGVQSGHDEQEADVEDLLPTQALAVDLGVQEARQHVGLRICAPRVQDLVEVVVDPGSGTSLDG